MDEASLRLINLERETIELQVEEWCASARLDQTVDEHPEVKATEEASTGMEPRGRLGYI
jgi:hypothetical protein